MQEWYITLPNKVAANSQDLNISYMFFIINFVEALHTVKEGGSLGFK
jgi:hypothetical protein